MTTQESHSLPPVLFYISRGLRMPLNLQSAINAVGVKTIDVPPIINDWDDRVKANVEAYDVFTILTEHNQVLSFGDGRNYTNKDEIAKIVSSL